MRKASTVICLVILGLLFLSVSSSISAQKYMWTDKSGKARFTDTPPHPSQVLKPQEQKPRIPNYQRAYSPNKLKSAKVDLYVTSWCPYCKKAIKYFTSKGVRFTVYDIEKDKNAAQRKNQLDKKGGVPFAVVNGQRIHGYAPERYAEALRKK